MQHVTLNPLPAVQQSPKPPHGWTDLVRHPHGLLESVAGAHLVRNRTDTADASGNIGNLREIATAEKGLEEARWFVDLKFHPLDPVVLHRQVQGAFTLDAG